MENIENTDMAAGLKAENLLLIRYSAVGEGGRWWVESWSRKVQVEVE